MRRSHTISLTIDYPYDDAYRYLSDPLNYGAWAAVRRESYRPLDNGDWQGMTTYGGLRHFRFTPANPFGVLDHAVFVPGGEVLWTPMRITPNEGGIELNFTFFQRSGMSEAEFVSAIEWITTDFLTLKSLLEALRR